MYMSSHLTRTQMYLDTDILIKAKTLAKAKGTSLAAYFRDIMHREISVASPTISKKKQPKVIKLKTTKTVYYSTNHNDIYDK